MSGLAAGGVRSTFGRPALPAQVLDHVHDLHDERVAEHDRLQHVLLGHLAGEAFDHGDGVACAGDDQVEIALFQLAVGRHDDELAADAADADRAGRPRGTESARACRAALAPIMAQHIGIVLADRRRASRP